MTQCSKVFLSSRKIINCQMYLFLEVFICINLFCSNFTQGSLGFDNPKIKIFSPWGLCRIFCDRNVDCKILSGLSINYNLCLKMGCDRNIDWKNISRTSGVNDTWGPEVKCKFSDKIGVESSPIRDKQNGGKDFHVQRRLLSMKEGSNADEMVTTPASMVNSSSYGVPERDRYTMSTREPFNYTKYKAVMDYLRRQGSKDPVWAMFSIMLLMGIMLWAMWCCGMKKIQTDNHINVTIDEHFHYVSVRDILRSKKKYLSKKILQFKRRHMHRKHKYKRLKERESNDLESAQYVASDNSEEERLIYANDF